ncbi:MAG TPA: FAD-binding and (Fe-S)-binding domain-containing protein [Anaeromyxobacter sp.]|nr:FAD-binding and (Fe-S)-binding domain-containing protein [Anaeromyxobacter sp.]
MRRDEAGALPEPYLRFQAEASAFLPPGAVVADPVRTLAYGTDASFYRLVPRLVVRTADEEEVRRLLALASQLAVPVTFRAAGTSLSGQAVSDSVLLTLSGGWRRASIGAGGGTITLEPGVIGAEANAWLAPHGRKIGPDPASIQACMIGGIVANNASGMCCGISQNSYRTLERMRLVLADGTVLDSGDPGSRAAFAASHRHVLEGLSAIREELIAEPALAARIRHKHLIKNTTGYGLNAFLDFADPVEILIHLLVGSEGTLGFVSSVTLRTVEDPPHRASALLLFPGLVEAVRAAQALQGSPAAAAELMDRASLRAVEAKPGMPPVLRSLPPGACALLVEVQAPDAVALGARIEEISGRVAGIAALEPPRFTSVKAEADALWEVRRGLFPAVGAVRPVGTTVIIEDVAFPIEHLAAGAVGLQELLQAHGYPEGILFGHALAGNLHFVFTQRFDEPSEVERYRRFMEAVCALVVGRFDGSLKAEHGTGRNMAPFVEREWGARAYEFMRRVKALLDPKGVLNPGVLLSDDSMAHVRNLKLLPAANDLVDRCTECGFCEPRCPSRSLSLTPRQRIVLWRERARLLAVPEDVAQRQQLERAWSWLGDQTCATDGLCATACPVGIDTGKLVKALRAEGRSPRARRIAAGLAHHYAGAVTGARVALGAASAARAVLGARGLSALSRGARAASGGRLPLWNAAMPRAAPRLRGGETIEGQGGPELVYLPSCVVRSMGGAPGDPDARAEFEAMLSVLGKAGCRVHLPPTLASLCCGLTFESKGFPDLAAAKAQELEAALLEASAGGRLPVVCETSPCTYHMRQHVDPRIRVFEPAEWIHDRLRDRLRFERRAGTVAIHLTCSSAKMPGVGDRLRALAEACAERVVAPPVGCCGFAGDRGFSHPELNAAALHDLRASLPAECTAGYSNSRTCQIGLTVHAGIPYQSIVHLVDRCTAARD